MVISEMIAILEKYKEVRGDVEVCRWDAERQQIDDIYEEESISFEEGKYWKGVLIR